MLNVYGIQVIKLKVELQKYRYTFSYLFLKDK